MKMRTWIVNASLLAIVGIIGFWLYGGFRVMSETFGLAFGSMLRCGGLCLLAAAPVIGIGLLLNSKRKPFIFAATATLFVAMIAAEILMFCDELRFLNEASDSNYVALKEGEAFSRPRAWPHGSASLVFVKGKGFHATD
jgi:hypothetical protein